MMNSKPSNTSPDEQKIILNGSYILSDNTPGEYASTVEANHWFGNFPVHAQSLTLRGSFTLTRLYSPSRKRKKG